MTRVLMESHGKRFVAYLKLLVNIWVILFAVGFPDTLLATQPNRPCNRSWDGAMGICVSLSECQNVKPEGTTQIRRPDLCEHQGPMPIVCCVPKKQPSAEEFVQALSLSSPIRDPTTRSIPIWLQKCMEYAKLAYENDEKKPESESKTAQCVQSNKAVGRAEFGEFPHMVAIGYEYDKSLLFNCGGSLISERYVLTTAHCVHGNSATGLPGWALLGQVSLKETKIKYEKLMRASQKVEIPNLIEISLLVIHPDFEPPRKYFDVGLLQLARSPQLGPYLRPACLSSGAQTSSLVLTTTGWGAQQHGKGAIDDLSKVTLLEAPFDECVTSYRAFSTWPSYSDSPIPLGLHKESMMCAGRPNSKADTCQGDSGGPLQANSPDFFCVQEIFGIVAFGLNCGSGVPGVYMRVEYFRSWIESVVWN